MLFYIYSDAPSSTIDITSRCRVGRMSVKDNAEEGSVAMSSLIIDDPDGDLEITGHRRMYIYESEAPIHDQVVFNGFVVNERVERGPYRVGAGRQWVIDLADPNVFINRRIMNGADANRPAETDLARIQALLLMTELNTVDDDTYVNTSATTVAMDAVDYRGQNVGAYVDDCRQASGKNGYILYNETVGQYGLWYDFAESSLYDSGCFLTNTIGEANHSTIFDYSQERTYLNRDPSRVASGIYLEYDGGTVYVQDSDTTDEFAAIDWAAPSINVKSLTKATARANRYLVDAATEHNIIHTVMTKVPRSKVNKVKKGQLVSFKSTYMTDFTEYANCRVLYRTVTEISEDPQASFEIEMDLDPFPPTTDYMLGFLVQRDATATGSGVEPYAHSVVCGSPTTPVSSQPWTWLGRGWANASTPNSYPFDVAYSPVGEESPSWYWGDASPLNGTSRPTGLNMIITGATGPPEIVEQVSGQTGPAVGSVGPGPVVSPGGGLMLYLYVEHRIGDNSGSTLTLTTPLTATELSNTMASANSSSSGFFPRAWLGSLVVTEGQSVDWVLTTNMEMSGWGYMVVFIPGAFDLAIDTLHVSGSLGGGLCWEW